MTQATVKFNKGMEVVQGNKFMSEDATFTTEQGSLSGLLIFLPFESGFEIEPSINEQTGEPIDGTTWFGIQKTGKDDKKTGVLVGNYFVRVSITKAKETMKKLVKNIF